MLSPFGGVAAVQATLARFAGSVPPSCHDARPHPRIGEHLLPAANKISSVVPRSPEISPSQVIDLIDYFRCKFIALLRIYRVAFVTLRVTLMEAVVRLFKSKAFGRFARSHNITDKDLCEAI